MREIVSTLIRRGKFIVTMLRIGLFTGNAVEDKVNAAFELSRAHTLFLGFSKNINGLYYDFYAVDHIILQKRIKAAATKKERLALQTRCMELESANMMAWAQAMTKAYERQNLLPKRRNYESL